MTLPVLLTLLAAVCFGVSSVLQHYGVNQVRRRFPLHPKLLTDVARQPLWLLGIAADVVAVALHMVAVNVGALSVVQPLLTLGLVVALGVQAAIGRPVTRTSLLAAALVVSGLAVFLAVRPSTESAEPQILVNWVPGLLLGATATVAALGVALAGRGRLRSLGLGMAAGALFALSAALVKTWGALLDSGGLLALATSWQLWTALGCGLLGALLSQAAFQAGALGLPLAAMMVTDPIVGVSLGVVVYGEQFSTGGLAVIQAAGLALTLAGVWLLATSQHSSGSPHRPADRPSRDTGPADLAPPAATMNHFR